MSVKESESADGSLGDIVGEKDAETVAATSTAPSTLKPEGDKEAAELERMMRKRNFVIAEIIDTEKAYLDRLIAVLEIFVEPLRKSNVIDVEEVKKQFGFWDVMVGIHRGMYETMCRDRENGTLKMGLVFFNFIHYLKVYKDYLVNFELALVRRGELMTSNKKFMQLVEEAVKDPRCFGLGIESLLIAPVQRIPRYKLLFTELLKCTPSDHEEYEAIANSLVKVSELASENNEAIRNRENKEQIMSIMLKIDSRTRVNLLDDPSRYLVRSALLQRQCRRVVKEFEFWLFSDKLLYGEIIPGLGTYWLHREIQLVACKISDAELTRSSNTIERSDCAIIVESPAKSFVIWTKSKEDKLQWLADIDKALELLRAKIKSETGRIAPIWVPDAKVNSCTICDINFGLFNRRHHCRNCGSIICGNCSKNRILIEHVDARYPVRVCDNCHGVLAATSKAANVATSTSPPVSPSVIVKETGDIVPGRRQSAVLRMLEEEYDTHAGRHPEESERETLMDFNNYKDEIDSVRSMTLTVENPVVSTRRSSAIALPNDAHISFASTSSTKAVVSSFDGRAIAAEISKQDTEESDYSSGDSDYEYTSAYRDDKNLIMSSSSKIARKSRKTKCIKPEELAAICAEADSALKKDLIPAESGPVDPHLSTRLGDVPNYPPPPAPPTLATPEAKATPPPKPPRKSGFPASDK